MTRLGAAFLLVAAAPSSAEVVLSQNNPPTTPPQPAARSPLYIPLSAEERWAYYVKSNFTLQGVGSQAGRMAFTNLWSNNPPEWGGGVDGFGKRFTTDYARSTVRRSVESAGAAALGHDPRFVRCPCDGPWKRVAHAVSQSVMTYDRNGKLVFGYARVGGRYTGAMANLAWLPERYSWKDGFREGSQSFAWVGAYNVVREFWPEIKGVFGR